MELRQLIFNYQTGDTNLFINILDKFKFTIKKFARNLNYEDAEQDLILYLLELITSINLCDFKNKSDGALVNYIYLSIKNKSTKLYKSTKNKHISLDIHNISQSYMLDEYNIELYSSLSCLNIIERKIIIDKYIKHLTFSEIASNLGVSRQTVYKNKNSSIKKLKKYFI